MKDFLNKLTPRHIKVIVTIGLAVATAFGIVEPQTATNLRNTVGVALDLLSNDAGDLL